MISSRSVLSLAALAALLLAAFAATTARSQSQIQVQALPSLVPIGVSASGGSSTVWFHEPSSRQTYACQTVQQGSSLDRIHCVSTKLPS